MKTLKTFGWLSRFLWIYMLVVCIIYGITFLPEITKENQPLMLVTFLGNKIPIENNGIYAKIFIIICYIIYLIYFYAVTLFNLCVLKFEKSNFFDSKSIKRFQKIGFIFIANYLIVFLLGKMYDINVASENNSIFLYNNISRPILKELQAPLGGLFIGVFFLVLSQVFIEAKKQKEENIELKQENELTI